MLRFQPQRTGKCIKNHSSGGSCAQSGFFSFFLFFHLADKNKGKRPGINEGNGVHPHTIQAFSKGIINRVQRRRPSTYDTGLQQRHPQQSAEKASIHIRYRPSAKASSTECREGVHPHTIQAFSKGILNRVQRRRPSTYDTGLQQRHPQQSAEKASIHIRYSPAFSKGILNRVQRRRPSTYDTGLQQRHPQQSAEKASIHIRYSPAFSKGTINRVQRRRPSTYVAAPPSAKASSTECREGVHPHTLQPRLQQRHHQQSAEKASIHIRYSPAFSKGIINRVQRRRPSTYVAAPPSAKASSTECREGVHPHTLQPRLQQRHHQQSVEKASIHIRYSPSAKASSTECREGVHPHTLQPRLQQRHHQPSAEKASIDIRYSPAFRKGIINRVQRRRPSTYVTAPPSAKAPSTECREGVHRHTLQPRLQQRHHQQSAEKASIHIRCSPAFSKGIINRVQRRRPSTYVTAPPSAKASSTECREGVHPHTIQPFSKGLINRVQKRRPSTYVTAPPSAKASSTECREGVHRHTLQPRLQQRHHQQSVEKASIHIRYSPSAKASSTECREGLHPHTLQPRLQQRHHQPSAEKASIDIRYSPAFSKGIINRVQRRRPSTYVAAPPSAKASSTECREGVHPHTLQPFSKGIINRVQRSHLPLSVARPLAKTTQSSKRASPHFSLCLTQPHPPSDAKVP